MNFELCKNKYFHISEGNINIEVSVSGYHLIYGREVITYVTKKGAQNDLNSIFEEVKTKATRKEVLDYLKWRFTTLPEKYRMGDF